MKKHIKFASLLNDISRSMKTKIDELVDDYGVESKFSNDKVLTIDALSTIKDGLSYPLSGGRYLQEISRDKLIDSDGHLYDFHSIELEELAELVDAVIEYTTKIRMGE